MEQSLQQLLRRPGIWRAGSGPSGAACATGHAQLDAALPGGGWPPAALTEILIEQYGIGELRLLMPALARLGDTQPDYGEPGWIAWVAPPFQPYPPALRQYGIDLSRMLIVRPGDASDVLWSTEQALSSGTCAAVLFWPEKLDDQASRRLQLAAEKGHSWAIAFRPMAARAQPSAAALRLELHPTQQADGQGMHVHILKSRGGRPTVINNLL